MVDHIDAKLINDFIQFKEYITAGSKDKKWAFDVEEPTRSKLLYQLNQNVYGSRHEGLLIYESNSVLSSVSSALGRGDFKNMREEYFEFKASYSSKVGQYSFWQVRLWQDLKGYVFKTIDRAKDFKITYFYLTKAQIKEEKELQNAKPTHGTKQVTNDNSHIELTFRYNPKKIEMKNRWETNYKQEDIFKCLQN